MKYGKFLLPAIAAACLTIAGPVLAAPKHVQGSIINLAPQPTTCVTPTFSVAPGANKYYTEVDITLTNNCGSAVNLQDLTVTFTNNKAVNTGGWGDHFNNVSYPTSLKVTSQLVSKGVYTASYNVVLPTAPWASVNLPAGDYVILIFGVNSAAGYTASSAQVFLPDNTPTQTGTLALTNSSAMPAGVTQAYAVVNLAMNGVSVKSVNLPWSGSLNVTGLSTGAYSLQPQSLTGGGNTYQGSANPASVTVAANQTVTSAISYTGIATNGSIAVKVPALPTALSGYTGTPSVTFTSTAGGTFTQSLPWNATTSVTQLANNTSYTLSTPAITFNGSNCAGTFNPTSETASATTPPTSTLSYQCTTVTQDKVAVNVKGAPSTTSSVNVTFTPSNNSTPVVQAVALTNGAGSATALLTDGVVYNVTAANVSGYTAALNPASFTATSTATETVTYTAQAAVSGRLITYVPGWETPPPATQLATAGYTHIMVAFGVFSTTSPGQIVSAFSTVTTTYIQQCHAAGLKVLLSVGGASTSSSGTSVNFDQVLSSASSPAAFESALVSSIESFMTQYGFDGVDFDIEQGFNAGGTFLKPTGDIAVLASVINTLRAQNPNMLITLVPQAANVAPDSGFDNTWDNYASLITQTGPALSWVQIQLYNTGSVYGIDGNLYTPTTSPDFSVAMATALLAPWPATINGQATGFNPYAGTYLTPSQVGVGYPVANSSGGSDGTPITPVATIKRAVECLRTAVKSATSCDTFVPPTTYPSFGTIFNWEATYDQSNNYAFATGLTACVLEGSC